MRMGYYGGRLGLAALLAIGLLLLALGRALWKVVS
jgi:hypothetical protein